jgi:nicotinamidase-related amidase
MLPGMNDQPHFTRSPELMSRNDTALAVIDVQQKLISLVQEHERIVWNIRRLIDGAKLLGLPLLATEQYPHGLGGTVPELAQRLSQIPDKVAFSSCGCDAFCQQLVAADTPKVLLVGIEAHVCVQQTALDLIANGYRVYVAADAIGSRCSTDYETALRRMELAGVTLTTTEAALFEWCRESSAPEFKQVSALVRELLPSGP